MHNILESFVMRKIKSCSNALSRQVREAVKITQDQSFCLLNLQEEYYHCVLTTLQAVGPPSQRIQMSLEPKTTPALTQSQEETALVGKSSWFKGISKYVNHNETNSMSQSSKSKSTSKANPLPQKSKLRLSLHNHQLFYSSQGPLGGNSLGGLEQRTLN